MFAEQSWEYYGRSGPGGVYELFRVPTGISNPAERFSAMERLRSNFQWVQDPEDVALRNEWASGWFDFEDDRLSQEQVDKFINDWRKTKWPGRP